MRILTCGKALFWNKLCCDDILSISEGMCRVKGIENRWSTRYCLSDVTFSIPLNLSTDQKYVVQTCFFRLRRPKQGLNWTLHSAAAHYHLGEKSASPCDQRKRVVLLWEYCPEICIDVTLYATEDMSCSWGVYALSFKGSSSTEFVANSSKVFLNSTQSERR